jgi:hypothetical protein
MNQQVSEPKARFWVGLHGSLTGQRSLLTKSKRKVRGQPDPTSHPVGPVGQIAEIEQDGLDAQGHNTRSHQSEPG